MDTRQTHPNERMQQQADSSIAYHPHSMRNLCFLKCLSLIMDGPGLAICRHCATGHPHACGAARWRCCESCATECKRGGRETNEEQLTGESGVIATTLAKLTPVGPAMSVHEDPRPAKDCTHGLGTYEKSAPHMTFPGSHRRIGSDQSPQLPFGPLV